MKPLRWLLAGLVWLVGGLLGLVGALLCVTIILLPLGIPVLMLARRLFSLAALLVLPRAARHPFQEAADALERGTKDARKDVEGAGKKLSRRSRRARRKAARGLEAANPVAS